MKKKIALALIGLPFFISVLTGCTTLHIHTFTVDYEHDEHSHWKTCKICHQKFEQHEHVFNQFNDTCFICDYHDPLVIVDQDNEMIGMTEYGKTKLTFDVPSNVTGIKKGAFDDAKAVTVKLNKELLYYDVGTFDDTSVKIITNEEGDTVQWEYDEESQRMKKHSDYQAMVDGVYYETLREAFDSVGVGDTTITLLEDGLKIVEPIEVKHSITLVGYFSKMTLTCDFNFLPNGILYVPDTIECIGTFKLLLSDFDEEHAKGDASVDGNTTEEAYTTGAVAFANKNSCPERVKVYYVTSLGAGAHQYEAIGAKQVANDFLIIPNNYFAFGTLRFTRDFKSVIGLTKFGQTVTKLTITNAVKGTPAIIGPRSFNIAWRIFIDLPKIIGDKYIRFCRPKGFFTDLTIGEGITSIGRSAFNNWIDGFFQPQLLEWIDIPFSHLFRVTIGPEVKEIGYHAFYDNVALTDVGIASSKDKTKTPALEIVGEEAFAHAYNLTSVDLNKANNLQSIKKKAFSGCKNLTQLALPQGRWTIGSDKYFPYDLTSTRAGALAHSNTGEWKKSDPIKDKPISYTKSNKKDSIGRFIDVEFTNDINEALTNCAQGGEIYISEEYKQGNEIDVSSATMTNLQLTINVAPELPTLLGRDFIVKRGAGSNITLNQNEYLILNNAKPVGDIVLKANGTTTQVGDHDHGTYMDPAGFATNLDEGFNVTLQNENAQKEGVSNEVVIRDNAYKAYGLFGFNHDDYITATNPQIEQLSNLSKVTSTLTFGDQYEVEQGINSYIDINRTGTPFSSLFSEITHINFVGSVDAIGRNTFANFKKLKEVTFGENLTQILDGAFKNCSGLETVDFTRVNTKGENFIFEPNVFSGCTSLNRLDIPEGTIALDPTVYKDCVSLSSITLPSTLTTIPSFEGYTNLIFATLPSTLTSIPANGFKDCIYLSYIDIPDTVTSIGNSAFEGCGSLTSLALPGGLTTIGEKAFMNCVSLESVTLPDDNSLASIGAKAFSCADSENPEIYVGSLMSFHLGNNINWKAGETALTEDLGDGWVAAKCISQTYDDLAWTRII
ncbi:MAG: leucine-rich repeat domain-containing protein [Bacilli bacterium]|nr:leucine-rich repeat domain-containing protein [Bacilli bacterium]